MAKAFPVAWQQAEDRPSASTASITLARWILPFLSSCLLCSALLLRLLLMAHNAFLYCCVTGQPCLYSTYNGTTMASPMSWDVLQPAGMELSARETCCCRQRPRMALRTCPHALLDVQSQCPRRCTAYCSPHWCPGHAAAGRRQAACLALGPAATPQVSSLGSNLTASLVTRVTLPIGVQSLLWDVVASSVPWDVQPPAEGKVSAHETLAKTLLLLLMSAPGIPTLPQDVTEDGRHRDALAQCLAFRKAYAAQLLPSSFLPARKVHWHGATPGDALAWALQRYMIWSSQLEGRNHCVQKMVCS